MAKRFYLPRSGSAPPVSPAYSAAWEKTSGAIREILQRDTPSNTSLGAQTVAGNGVNPSDILLKQYVSPALAAQTILAGTTVKGQILCSESSAALNAAANMRLYVYRPSDSSVVGVLIEMLSGGSSAAAAPEFNFSTVVNRKFPRSWSGAGQTVAGQVVVQDGDVLVLEVGYGQSSVGVTSGTLRFGDPTAGGDLPEDETTTTDSRPWIEISQDILYSSDIVSQIAHPVADIAVSAWTTDTGATTNLWSAIDEDPASAADYIQGPLSPTSASEHKIRLGPLAATAKPRADDTHKFDYEYVKDVTGGDTINLTVTLYRANGTTVVHANTHNNIDAKTTGQISLTGTEADTIPDEDFTVGLVMGFSEIKV